MVFALNASVTLTFDLVTSKSIGVIYLPWPIFLRSRRTVSHKHFKILSGHGFCIKCFCDLDLWPSDLIIYRVIYWPCPIYLPRTTTVTQKLFKLLRGHDVANWRTDRRTDGRHTIIRPKFHFGRIKRWIQCKCPPCVQCKMSQQIISKNNQWSSGWPQFSQIIINS